MHKDPLVAMKRIVSEISPGMFSFRTSYLADDSARITVDRIARFETLQEEFNDIMDRIGLLDTDMLQRLFRKNAGSAG